MSFVSRNHPQQVAARGALDDVDDRGTDPEFIAELEARFGHFHFDAAASDHNAKARDYHTIRENGLEQPWGPPYVRPWRVWCNPPYSDCRSWVHKAWTEWDAERASLIVMLLPANRVEQAWWQDLVEPYRDGRSAHDLRVEFLRGRMRFDRPGWAKPTKGDRPPFGCCLLIWGGDL